MPRMFQSKARAATFCLRRRQLREELRALCPPVWQLRRSPRTGRLLNELKDNGSQHAADFFTGKGETRERLTFIDSLGARAGNRDRWLHLTPAVLDKFS